MADENVETVIQFDLRPGELETILDGQDWTVSVSGVAPGEPETILDGQDGTASVSGAATEFNAVRVKKNEAGEVVAVQLVKYSRD